ncbi:MAG: hypothetical protein KAU28_10955, partial [Phycisphaerae bacterium]|nr:hypothetical protein [Phycisphaerae bacterium]
IELMVVVVIIMLLIGIMLPSLTRFRMLTWRNTCAVNLREIARGCTLYAEAGRFHRGGIAYALPTVAPTAGNWTTAKDGNPACLWLVIEYELVPRKNFICPHAEAARKFTAPDKDDDEFSEATYSYSYLTQVPFEDEGVTYYETTIDEVPSQLVILADRTPRWKLGGGADASEEDKNSKNHDREGQNFANLGGSVVWTSTTDVGGDNIYSSDGSGGARGGFSDSYLAP